MDNQKWTIKNGQSRKTGNIDTRQTKQKHNTVCVGHHSGLIAIQQGYLPRGSNKCRTTV